MTGESPDAYEEVKRLLAEPMPNWPGIVASIDILIQQARLSPQYQRERDWYRVHTMLDLDDILKSPEERRAFWAGTMYAQCRQESMS